MFYIFSVWFIYYMKKLKCKYFPYNPLNCSGQNHNKMFICIELLIWKTEWMEDIDIVYCTIRSH